MSLSALFDVGKTAILTSQTALSVTSNNIANINTPGFSRQDVILNVASPVQVGKDFIGRGVVIGSVARRYDKFVNLQLLGQNQVYGRSLALENSLSQVEQVFNETKNLGLAEPLRQYFNAWQDVAANPEGQAQRTVLLQKAKALVQTAKQMEGSLLNTLKQVNEGINDTVERINGIAEQIASLNEKIVALEAGQTQEQAGFFRDQRDTLLRELGELTSFNSYENDNGAVTIDIGGRNLVSAEKASEISTAKNEDGDEHVYLGGDDVTDRLDKGQVGGYIAARDEIRATSLHDLRKLVASVVKETNLLHNSGYGLDGTTGNDLFDSLQLSTTDYSSGAYITSANITNLSTMTLDEYDINFVDASNYEIYDHQSGALVTSGAYTAGSPINFEGLSVTVDGVPAAGDSFFVSPLEDVIDNFDVAITDTDKIAAASASADLPGDNTLAIQIAQLSKTSISDLDGVTIDDYYRNIVSDAGSNSRAAYDSLKFDDNLRYELQKRREAVSGVSLDEEAANLIRYQRAFEAGARIIKITDELLQTVVNIGA